VRVSGEELLFVLSLPLWVVMAKIYGLYERDEERADHSTADDLAGVFHLVTVATWILYATCWLVPWATPRFPKLFAFWAFAICAMVALRVLARAYSRRQLEYLQNAIIVGAGDVGQSIARKLLNHPEYGINLVGFVDATPKERDDTRLEHLTLLGNPEDLPALVKLLDVERVIFAFSRERAETQLEHVRTLNELGIQVDIVPRLYEVVSSGVDVHSVEGIPLIGLPPVRLSGSSRLLKRAVDVGGAGLGLLLLSPLFLLVALLIKRDSRGPVFFRQERMGVCDRTFRIFKFRTMAVDAEARKHEYAHLNKHRRRDARMFKIDADPRVTRVGYWLRRYSVDELPQLINVLKGDMTLVGPRPLILDEDQYVSTWGRRRLDLKPGMTGLWQVLGRSEIPFDEMVRLDYLYVTTWSLARDLGLLLRTVPVVLRGETP
jgi:exopolysaccharide biosynthesis polyprenyl glycosylphosphotransferase